MRRDLCCVSRSRCLLPTSRRADELHRGFTLVELIIGAAVLAIAIAALLGAFLGQITLNEHARRLTLAMNDANRAMEQLRRVNTGCASQPSASLSSLPGGFTSWDQWLKDTTVNGGGGVSIPPVPAEERVFVTCQDNATLNACGTSNQVGTGEWKTAAGNTAYDPIRITVAVCWRHRGRVLGECTWNGAALQQADGTMGTLYPTANVIESPAMLTTLMTCRQ